jgi:DNA-binding FrmR family transcriptional regulator
MSLDISILSAVAGMVASVAAVAGSSFLKNLIERRKKRGRNEIQEAARTRLTEIRINVGGIGFSYQIEKKTSPEAQVASQLLKEVEQGIVEGVSDREGLSREQVRKEVEHRMTEVQGRLEAIEKRFPDDATIDKIVTINDALFAQRIEQLSTRIEKLEEKMLTKWDVALIVSTVVAGIFAVVGATYAVLKVFSHAPGP